MTIFQNNIGSFKIGNAASASIEKKKLGEEALKDNQAERQSALIRGIQQGIAHQYNAGDNVPRARSDSFPNSGAIILFKTQLRSLK